MEPKRIKLDTFHERDYQIDIFDAIEKKDIKKAVLVWHRRAGKDVVGINLILRSALRRIGLYLYLLPTAVQARRVMFDGITLDGRKMLDFIPKELIKSINIAQMKVILTNDSIILFAGSDHFDSLRGQNPLGCILSEYAYMHPAVYPTIRPALMVSNGFCVFVSTPFADNHFHEIYKIAKDNPTTWFSQVLTIEDTGVVTKKEIDAEIERGELSPDMAAQEYLCSFSIGATGAYYSKYLNDMELKGQITTVNWEPDYPCISSWDLGMRDLTVILVLQCIDRRINIIDMYSNSDVGLEHYIHWIQTKPYKWSHHVAPHDIAQRDYSSGGITRLEKAERLGVTFTVSPPMEWPDAIECVRTTLPRIYIDAVRCSKLVNALRNYRKEYDSERKVYNNKPLHDINSHYADSLRHFCSVLPRLQDTSNAEELDRRFQQVKYGRQDHSGFFADDRR